MLMLPLRSNFRSVARSSHLLRSFCSSDDVPKAATSSSSTDGPKRPPVAFEDVVKAMYRIRSGILNTTCLKSHTLSELIGCNVFLKNDFRQFSGSFKERGARNALMTLHPDKKKKGVIAASAGNHALALAYHGRLLGIPVTCIMPTVAPFTKVNNCRKFGGRVIIKGAHIGESKDHAMEICEAEGLHYINGYDDPAIIAGAGTMAIEFLEQVSDLDVVVVPAGGAGLVAGIGLAVKAIRPECKVIAVEPKAVASLSAAMAAGRVVPATVDTTLADGLAVPMVGPTAFEVARHVVDEVVTVDERSIALGVLRAIELERIVLEGSAGAGLAALLPGGPLDRPEFKGKNVLVPLCGANIDLTTLGRVIDRGMAADGRLVQFTATVSDRPGGIATLTKAVADIGVSIKDIFHERAWLHSDIASVSVKCVVETTGPEHVEELRAGLEARGYDVHWGPAVY